MKVALLPTLLCASSAFAQYVSYRLLTLIPGHKYETDLMYDDQTDAVKLVDGIPLGGVFSGGQWQMSDGEMRFVYVAGNGQLTLGDISSEGQEGFAIDGEYLTFQGNDAFSTCPSQGYTVYYDADKSTCSDITDIKIKAIQASGF